MIQPAKTGQRADQLLSSGVLFNVILLIILLGWGLYATNVFKAIWSSTAVRGVTTVSQSTLEETYGLRMNLIAVTAAGGMVDVRLHIVDAQKAKSLLQDKKNFPSLLVRGSNAVLNVSEEAKSQEIKFEEDGNVFLLFPNAGGAVKRGSSVTLLFGSTALEPIQVR